MGIQFFHYNGYSREVSTTKEKYGHSIYTIAGEADRIEGYYEHVKNPIKPVILHGVSFSEVVKTAEEYAEKTIDSIGRKVKKKDLIMIAGVISAPEDMSYKVWEEYKKESLKWLKEKWGDALKSVIEHFDEPFQYNPNILHRHIHFACAQKIGIRFWKMHPGLVAKREADKAYGMTKKPNAMSNEEFKIFKTENRKAGDKAYREQMSKEQDKFYTAIGEPFGLLRYGPKRLRYSREEIIMYNQEKRIKQKNILKRAEEEKDVRKRVESIIAEANTIKNEALKFKEDTEIKTQAKIKDSWKRSNDIINAAKKEALKEAESITNKAHMEASSIIDKARDFIVNLLDEFDKIPHQKVQEIIKKAKAYIKTGIKPTYSPKAPSTDKGFGIG
ncbi:MAG: hypothetical protein FWD14_08005 [Treponema sp.]|nr:hypothetical protein [Treponema sp.]